MFVCCECCVLSGRGLCNELITHPEESYRLWCIILCDLEKLKNEEAMTRVGSQRHSKKKKNASVNKIFIIFKIASALNLKFFRGKCYKRLRNVSAGTITLCHGQHFVHQLWVQQGCTRKWEVLPQASNVKE